MRPRMTMPRPQPQKLAAPPCMSFASAAVEPGSVAPPSGPSTRASCIPFQRSAPPSELDDDVVVLDRDGVALGDVRAFHEVPAGLALDVVVAQPRGAWVAPGLAGGELELPAVPGAAQEFPVAFEAIVAGTRGLRDAGDDAGADPRAAMRTAVQQRMQPSVDVEQCDLAAVDEGGPARARRQFVGGTDDVAAHDRRYNAIALSLKIWRRWASVIGNLK